MVENIILVIKSPPYGGGNAAEGLRIAMAMIAMDVLPRLLFLDDGVYCLLKNQAPEAGSLASLGERLKTLSDLVGLYAMSISMTKRNLQINDLEENYNVKMISSNEATKMIMESDTTITF